MSEVLLNTLCVTLIMASIIVIVYGCVHIVKEVRNKHHDHWGD